MCCLLASGLVHVARHGSSLLFSVAELAYYFRRILFASKKASYVLFLSWGGPKGYKSRLILPKFGEIRRICPCPNPKSGLNHCLLFEIFEIHKKSRKNTK
jgi:hypothetical protein